MIVTGYVVSILIGISLGVIGGGGSILTVPVLVYLFHMDVLAATACSLFIVGVSSAAGTLSYAQKRSIDLKTALIFGLPSIVAVLFTRAYLLPAIPREIFHFRQWAVTRETMLMLLFAVLMLLASYSMIKRNGSGETTGYRSFHFPLILVQGVMVGVLTGLVGAGGGFLIIPALVNWLKMPMKTAIGTSLLIIAVNAAMGFLFSLRYSVIQWPLLAGITLLSVAGIFIGGYLSARVDGRRLKPAFGWFTLVTGIAIIVKEIISVHH